MPKIYLSRLLWQLIAVCCVVLICLGFQSPHSITSAPVTGTTWSVTSVSDNVNDGSVISHTGSLRFALAHAASGDLVKFVINAENTIVVNSTLTVPEGVAVGLPRDGTCGDPNSPRANIQANLNPAITVDPVFSLSANSTLRNVDVGGGQNSVKITGANVDVCGTGLGIQSSGETSILPPHRAVLIIDGENAVIHRNIFYGESPVNQDIIVGVHGSDSRIGDMLYGSGDSNEGWCTHLRLCAVRVITGSASAAQRVTIRDVFWRFLAGMPGSGVRGGDDDLKHANNWAQTPAILTAETFDNFATVRVFGTANPLSLVDIYFDDHLSITRQRPVTATAAGTFEFMGVLPGSSIWVMAVSTLNDPAHPNHLGSSSQFSDPALVTPGVPTTQLQLNPTALTFSAVVGEANPPAQYLSVSAPSMTPTLAWQTSVTTTDGLNWLSALPVAGSGNDTISVTVDATGLMTGTYSGSVDVVAVADPSNRATAGVVLMVGLVPPVLVPRVWLPIIMR